MTIAEDGAGRGTRLFVYHTASRVAKGHKHRWVVVVQICISHKQPLQKANHGCGDSLHASAHLSQAGRLSAGASNRNGEKRNSGRREWWAISYVRRMNAICRGRHTPTTARFYVGGATSLTLNNPFAAVSRMQPKNSASFPHPLSAKNRTPFAPDVMAGRAVSPELENQYVRLDFETWNVTFALRSHAPGKNRHGRELSAAETKEEVLRSTRLQRIVREVKLFCILYAQHDMPLPHCIDTRYVHSTTSSENLSILNLFCINSVLLDFP